MYINYYRHNTVGKPVCKAVLSVYSKSGGVIHTGGIQSDPAGQLFVPGNTRKRLQQ
jgi:hypothetical protein